MVMKRLDHVYHINDAEETQQEAELSLICCCCYNDPPLRGWHFTNHKYQESCLHFT